VNPFCVVSQPATPVGDGALATRVPSASRPVDEDLSMGSHVEVAGQAVSAESWPGTMRGHLYIPGFAAAYGPLRPFAQGRLSTHGRRPVCWAPAHGTQSLVGRSERGTCLRDRCHCLEI